MCFRWCGAGNRKYQASFVELLQHTCCSSTIINHWLYKDRLEPQMKPDCLSTFHGKAGQCYILASKVFVASYLMPSVYSPLRSSFLEPCWINSPWQIHYSKTGPAAFIYLLALPMPRNSFTAIYNSWYPLLCRTPPGNR